MKLSVALCTYNGAAYLEEQLNSYLEQEIIPHELVVCDDLSSDHTLQIVQAFAARATFQVHIHRNEQRLGSTKNFEKAISLCTGDIIFFSDQDDIWLPQKTKEIIKFFEAHPDKQLVFTDGIVIDNNKNELGTLWEEIRFTSSEREQWEKGEAIKYLLRYNNRATGATMAVKKELLGSLLPFEQMNLWIHDGIMLMKALLKNKAGYIEKTLILYRQHQQQQIGIRPIVDSPFKIFIKKITTARWINKDEFLKRQYEDLLTIRRWLNELNTKPEVLKYVDEKINHFHKRVIASGSNIFRRSAIVLPEWIKGKYGKFTTGVHVTPWSLVLKDLLGK